MHHDFCPESCPGVTLGRLFRKAGVGREFTQYPALPDIVACAPNRPHAEPREQADQVRIHDEHRLVSSVEDDAIGGFGADAERREQTRAEFGRGNREQRLDRAVLFEEGEEGAQLELFLAELAGGPDKLFQLLDSERGHRLRCEHVRCAQAVQRAFDVRPHGVLDEDGADTDLEGVGIGPPVPIAPAVHGLEGAGDFADVRGGWHGRHGSDPSRPKSSRTTERPRRSTANVRSETATTMMPPPRTAHQPGVSPRKRNTQTGLRTGSSIPMSEASSAWTRATP